MALPLAERSELGRAAHRRYRQQRAQAVRGFRAEVPVAIERRMEGYRIRVAGRVDGWFREGKVTIIEEAKSIIWSLEELARQGGESLAHHALQVRLYALAAREGLQNGPVAARLAVLSLVDDAWQVHDVPFDASEVEVELRQLLGRLIAAADHARERRCRLAAVAKQLRFPYSELRPGQGRWMEGISSSLRQGRPVLAQAATGTGKTVCALLAALGFALPRDASLWFVTAKTTQQQLVARTFLDVCAASRIRPGQLHAVTLRAKERMCPAGDLTCHEQLCPFLRDFQQRLAESDMLAELTARRLHVAPDGIYARAARAGLCPFRLSLAVAAEASLVIADYNYVYDAPPQGGRGEDEHITRPTVVVVDEAHNLAERVRQSQSAFIGYQALHQLRRRTQTASEGGSPRRGQQLRLLEGPEPVSRLARDLALILCDSAQEMDEHLRAAELAGRSWSHGCAVTRFDARRWRRRCAVAVRWLLRHAAHCRARGTMRSRDSAVELLREICRMSTLVRDERAELVPYVARHDSARGRGVGVLCVDPAPWLARHHRAVAGTVLMSATLEPQDYYTAILGLDALPIATQRLPSPFPRRNRCIRIVPSVATTFRRRAASTRRVARIIGQVLAAQPGRYAAFFPSFAYLEGVRRRLPLSSRRLIVQRRTMTAADREDSLRELRRRRGTVLLLAVAGGAFAEGIDLPGKGLMGAIIVGPALPPVGFETAMMRDYYEGRYRRGFAFAMLYPGMQRVIQAAGRVIRSPHDRGVIVLVGRRFAEADYAACLPAEWYHDDPRELLTDGLGAALHDFWQRQAPATPAAMHVPAFKPSSPRPARR